MTQDERSARHAEVERLIQPAINAEGKVDIVKLRESNPSLAAVLNEFMEGKTSRDDPTPVAKDLARTLEARHPESRLSAALTKLEGEMRKGR
jgi:hypothetical protein